LPLEINTSVGARGRIIRENFDSDNIMRSLGNISRFTATAVPTILQIAIML